MGEDSAPFIFPTLSNMKRIALHALTTIMVVGMVSCCTTC